MKNKFYIFSSVMVFAYIAGACGASNPQINRLFQQKQQKMAQLEQCAKKVNGFKIAGISTLGLTAAGVAGNVALASKNEKLNTEIQDTQSELDRQKEKLADINAEIAKSKQGSGKESGIQTPRQVETKNDIEGFVLTCKEAGVCELKGQNIPAHTSCNEDFNLAPGNPIFVHFDEPEGCYKKLGEMQKQPELCDFESYVFATELDAQEKATPKGRRDGGYLFFCRGDGEIVRAYESTKSYEEKKCVSTFGKWEGGQCECHTDLEKIDGECRCPTNSKFRYPIKTPWIASNYGPCDHGWLDKKEIISYACTNTGGRVLTTGACGCPSTMILNKDKNMCDCKPGTKYIDPERKSEGCK